MQSGLPIHTGPVDHLRYGFESLATEAAARHPVDAIQRQDNGDWNLKLDSVRRIYGSHMAMRLAAERIQFSRPHRLPGLPSNNLGRDVCLGLNDKIEFSDFLNDPRMRADAPKITLHDVMEVRLGMQ